MATTFVYSGAAGANNGTDWANAWTSLASANGAAAGDTVKIHKTHTQTLAANVDFTNGTRFNPVYLISVDKDAADVYTAGAAVNFSGNNTGIRGSVVMRGVSSAGTAAVNCPTIGALSNGKSEYHDCTFSQTSSGFIQIGVPNNIGIINRFIGCTFDFTSGTAATVAAILAGQQQHQEYINCTFIFRVAGQTNAFRVDFAQGADVTFRACYFNGTVTNIFDTDATDEITNTVFDECRMMTYTNVVDTAFTHTRGRIEIRNSVAGTITDPVVGPNLISDYAGTIASDLTRYRDNGATDKFNPYSLAMVCNASAVEFQGYVATPWMGLWVEAGDWDITVYFASGGTLQDDEFWIEVFSPSEAGSPTAQGTYYSSRMVPYGTPANLTSDGTSTWNGAGVGTKQKISVNIDPTVAGRVLVRALLAKASTTVYVDPLPEKV